MWIWLVLLYGVLKGGREICKKKALLISSSIEVLLMYTMISFLLVCPDAKNAMGMDGIFYLFVALKALVIFIAWICSFKAIKALPLSFYGVLDLSRVLFATLLGLVVLGESMSMFNIIGLFCVCLGLFMLKFNPILAFEKFKKNHRKDYGLAEDSKRYEKEYALAEDNKTQEVKSALDKDSKTIEKLSTVAVIAALASCMLNSISGLADKILMQYINSSQLQFWYMLFLCVYYIIYACFSHAQVNIKRAVTNKWIWLLSIMFVVADRALFIANAYPESQVTVMTLLKQSGVIITILGGKFVFKEKNIAYKLLCAGIMIAGIVLGVM